MNAQEKVVILDSLQAKKIIRELIEKDALKSDNAVLIKMDSISKSRIQALRLSNDKLLLAYNEKENQVLTLNKVIENDKKIIAKEKSKNKFLKVVSLLSLITTGVLLITR